ncbi:60S ACIDIC ribosomal protein P1 [Anaeramoeba ignava]|uniref:60S ACIDIC ribosomal protein P1 n=1 Tax=Anaeramoeba ignava TaxID=1746090 RepID=A0A9Q0RDS5_ANAIG|nr:60S ACIDIC ribosomal protein P1 [Anaeramoeba ignava]|eukprot:Anaeramoba_ignava/a91688_254.p1 GENE.a91688_254~~a91688_254.p1  ORF type:complete len:122 (-),score=56.57 a91688_254:158-523(-)
MDTLSRDQKEEMAITFAVLLLQQEQIKITPDKLKKVLDAADVSVEPYWFKLFTNYAEENDISALLSGAPTVVSGPVGQQETQQETEVKEDEKPEVQDDEPPKKSSSAFSSDGGGIGLGLFD